LNKSPSPAWKRCFGLLLVCGAAGLFLLTMFRDRLHRVGALLTMFQVTFDFTQIVLFLGVKMTK
jgi:hypothetical protein